MGTQKWLALLAVGLLVATGCYYYEDDYLRASDRTRYGYWDRQDDASPTPADPQAAPSPPSDPYDPYPYDAYRPAPAPPSDDPRFAESQLQAEDRLSDAGIVESDFDVRVCLVGVDPEQQEEIERDLRNLEGVDGAETLEYQAGEMTVGVVYKGSLRALHEALGRTLRYRVRRYAVELVGSVESEKPLQVRIFAPGDGARLVSSTVFVGVEVKGSDRPRVTVNGVPADSRPTPGRFSARILLDPGENEIVAVAVDEQGRRGVAKSTVFITDGEAPVEDDAGLTVLVQGKVDDPLSTVTVDGKPVTVEPDGSYRVEVPLRKGQAFVVVVAVDSLGNKTVRKIPVGGR